MSPETFIDWSTLISLVLLGLALLVSLVRIVLGPTLSDRILALDLLTGAVQAYIFTILAAVYIGGAAHPDH